MIHVCKRWGTFLILMLVLLGAFTVNAKANADEPPMLWILISGEHKDLSGTLQLEGVTLFGRPYITRYESYLRFYFSDEPQLNSYTKEKVQAIVTIHLAGEKYIIEDVLQMRDYNTMYTFDLDQKTLFEGKSLARSIQLVGLRVILTIFVEALIFFLFGFKEKRIWIAFILINLFTQGILHGLLNAEVPVGSYAMLALVFYEIVILIVEWLVFFFVSEDQRKAKLMFTVFVANMASLILGGFLITMLPL